MRSRGHLSGRKQQAVVSAFKAPQEAFSSIVKMNAFILYVCPVIGNCLAVFMLLSPISGGARSLLMVP